MEVVLKDVSFFDPEVEHNSNLYTNLNRKRKHGELHKIVESLSLRVQPGSVTVLMGAPQETRPLLELIGLRQRNGFIVGGIYHDNSLRKNGSCFRDIAYVKDFDSNFFGHLTVEDFLGWAAQLRLSLGEAECAGRAREAAKLLGLEGHVCIADLHRGERILLAVAAELVENPTLVCIESPLDGLEESHVAGVTRALSTISHRQNTATTIVFTALAPSAASFAHIDHVAVFFNTRLLYSSGEMFDYMNPHWQGQSDNTGSGDNDRARRKLVMDDDGGDERAPPAFREVILECREVLCTMSRDISRSGYGTAHFTSQFVGSDHRRTRDRASTTAAERGSTFLRGGGEEEEVAAEKFLTGKRVDAIEVRLAHHLATIATLCSGFENEERDDEEDKTR